MGIIGGSQYRDKDLRLADLACKAVDDRDSLASIINKLLLTGAVVLAHDHIQLALPGPVVIAEPTVLVALGMGRSVLLPEQEQGDAFELELTVNNEPVGNTTGLGRQIRGGRCRSWSQSCVCSSPCPI